MTVAARLFDDFGAAHGRSGGALRENRHGL